MIGFPRAVLSMPRPWVVWVMLLFGINLVPSLIYLASLEGKVVLAALMLGGLFQTAIFEARGFVRLLGIGHVAWLPMVLWLWMRMEAAPQGSVFRYWLLAVIIINSLSLIIDTVDVIRYIRGEREPLQSPEPRTRTT